jgi:hypothetical protein
MLRGARRTRVTAAAGAALDIDIDMQPAASGVPVMQTISERDGIPVVRDGALADVFE